MINNVVIVGGGVGGWYTAAAFVHNFPNVSVTVVDSDKHPRLGVGETLGWSAPYDWKRQLGLKANRFNGRTSDEMLQEFHPQWA